MSDSKSVLPTASASRPRLACRIARARQTLFGASASRHTAACAACREYFRAADALETALRRDATRAFAAPAPADDSIERGILRAVREARVETAPSRSRPWTGAWALGGAAAAVLVAFTLFHSRPTAESPRAETAAVPVTEADAAAIVESVESISNRLVDSVIPSAGKLAVENPLQQEIGLVYSDMRSAIDFLALNFLPAPAAAPQPRARTI